MGAMNKGGNGLRCCTGICNTRTVLGEYHCPVCRVFTDDKTCICYQSPVAGHAVGKNAAVAGTDRRMDKMTHYDGPVNKRQKERNKALLRRWGR